MAVRKLTPLLFSLTLVLQGCATQSLYLESSLASEDAACLRWFENLDTTLAEYAVEDPGVARIAGFPQIRTDRFLASLRDRAAPDNAFAQWLEQMRQLDADIRPLEFANLPASAVWQLAAQLPQGKSFAQTVQLCGKRLTELSLNNPEHKQHLLQQAKVPDAYQTWKRTIGVYALAQYAAGVGIERLHRELAASFRQPLEKLPVAGRLERYRPPPTGEPLSAADIAAMLHQAYANPLTIPSLSNEQLQRLLEHFAPIWEIDTRNTHDEIGAVTLDWEGNPRIDSANPTVYVTHAFTRWHGKVLLQLIYQIWLPEREKTGVFDLYGGALDSVIWRVTLSPEGEPIAYDSIHACGCYYLLFPAAGYRAIPPQDGAEPVLSPMSIPTVAPGQRLLLRLQNRTHYLQQVAVINDNLEDQAQHYDWQAAEQLRSLPLPDGTHRSLFRADGIVDASERAERFLLWPFGVPSPGAMREWGTHAIAFTGRRHFDDAFLLEKLLAEE